MKKQVLYILATIVPMLTMGQITEVANINPGGDSNPAEFYVDSSNKLFFSADNGTDGKELYVYNGTATTLIDINNSAVGLNSTPARFIEFNGKIYFKANDETTKSELWETDGTIANTKMVADINPGTGNGNPDHFFIFNNELYFTPLDGTSTQIWALNGGTPIKITANNGGAYSSASYPYVASTGVFMRINNGNGNELGFFTGTGNVTEVLDIRPGSSAGFLAGTDGKNMKLLGNKFFFEADSTGPDDELWVSDGTTVGTFQVANTNPSGAGDPDDLEVYQGEMFFASKGANGYQLWKSNGTVLGTVLVADVNPGGDGAIENLYSNGTTLYFAAKNGTDGVELWKYDGATASMVKNINSAGDSSPANFIALNGMVYFSANDGTGVKLWMTNGTSTGTVLVASLFGSGENPTNVNNLKVRDGKLMFSGTGTNGNELYSFDPATLSTEIVTSETIKLFPNPASNYIMVSKSLLNTPFTIHDITGKTMQQGIITSEKVNLNLNSGLYLIKIKTDLNTITKKIIIK